MAVHTVIMAGGVGARFWPKSRKNKPKQLLNVVNESSLIQETFKRMQNISSLENIYISTNSGLVNPIMEQLPQLKNSNFILEPFGKNTAPCIAMAAFHISKIDPEGVMVVVPADHLIMEDKKFLSTINGAVEFSKKNNALVTLGISPGCPETGYGYIQRGELVEKVDGNEVYRVKTFAEKPNLETATRFLESGDFYWNSGMFVWRADVILKSFEEYLPDIYEELGEVYNNSHKELFEKNLETAYKKIKSISIDYGIMQNAENVFMLPGNFYWNDVGSWDVVVDLPAPGDKQGNKGNVIQVVGSQSKNNYIDASNKIVALVGVEDLIVVDTDDALLICKKGESQRIKEVVDELKIKGLEQYL